MNKLNNNKYNSYNSNISYQKPNKKNNKDILSIDKFQTTNFISDKKNEEKSLDKNIIISEFSPNDKNNKNEENENIIISNNLNVFSFNFDNVRNENIEEDDADDCVSNTTENKIDNIKKIINFSSKNMLIYSEKNNLYKKLKSLFVSYITNKLAVFLTDIINKLLLYNFLKLFIQKTKKITIHIV